jgi:hypothetical protein
MWALAHLDICKGDAQTMNVQGLANLIRINAKRNAPALLTAGACVGVIGTIVLTARQSRKAAKLQDEWDELNGISDSKFERALDIGRVTYKCWAPVAISGGATIACIVGANKLNTNRLLTAQGIAAVAVEGLDQYRGKVRELWGEKKDQEIMGKVAEEKIQKNPPPSQDVLITGPGNVLCCELYTGRYFTSDVESLRKAQNLLNKRVLAHDYATMGDFQYLIGLPTTTNSQNVGWTSSRLMELEISAILTNDERPCLAFDYNYTVPV